MGFLLLLSTIVLLMYLFYKWGTLNNDYFKRQGLKYMKPTFLLGNTAGLFFKTKTVYDYVKYLYNSHPNEKIIGFFTFRRPTYLIRDPEIIKRLTIKDFDYFADHQFLFDASLDKLLGKSIFLMKGQQWRDMRATLSPAFTGSKMRQMHELIVECSEQMAKYFVNQNKMITTVGDKNTNNGNAKRQIVKMKEIFGKYSTDVIASCAFGLSVDSFENVDNEFYKIGQMLSNFKSIKPFIKMFILRVTPWLTKIIYIPFIDNKVKEFFSVMVTDTMEYRQKNNIIRPDMINILLQVKNGTLQQNSVNDAPPKGDERKGFATAEESIILKTDNKRNWSDLELIAQCFTFFLAGYDPTSSILATTVYELARNVIVQQKLISEIDEKNESLNGKRINYDELQNLSYLDQVISESLRIWGIGFLDRECVKDYHYQDEHLSFVIPKGYQILMPITGIHADPQYFSNPDSFDPERFNDDNKQNINPLTYMPFGSGPRNCIGSRFALMQMKTILYYLLLNFTFEVCEKTQIPLIMDNSILGVYPSDGLFIELRYRHKHE